MEQYMVSFPAQNLSVPVSPGTTVLDAERKAGLIPDAPCGGQGTCGKCLVTVLKDGTGETVKACQYRIHSDLTVETREMQKQHEILTRGTGRQVKLDPVIRGGFVTFRKLRLGEPLSQWERIQAALEETFGEPMEDLQMDLPLASGLYDLLRQRDTWYVVLGEHRILSITEDPVPVLGAAVDIGTTSVVGYLLDLSNGQLLATESRINPQSQYGADVIMRSQYAMDHGTEPLSTCIRDCLQEILSRLAEDAGRKLTDIFGISVAGNTCMHHLFLGISPGSLSHAPYNPAVRQQLTIPAEDLGLSVHPRGQVFLLPNIAGFVGGDTVGCLLSVRPDLEETVSLMIDIGTNGEMVLGSKNKLIACSTAAGPAFEGAKIECGMRGAGGAVDHVRFRDGSFSYTTVGGEKPVGICGSGLIDLTAALRQAELVDESGYLCLPEGGSRFFLVPEADKPVYLSQKDIREVQLAKAAIAAGITLLCRKLDITLEQIGRVYIAGAFGNYMDPDSACSIGLIPAALREKIIPVGNAAGEGAKLVLLNRQSLEDSRRLSGEIGFLELATSPEFQDCFVDELEFP